MCTENYPHQSVPGASMLEQAPAVSVIICAYNAEKYISKSIGSVLNQTYQAFELIIVDDASTDATCAIASQHASKDSRIKIVRRESNGGLAHARMSGFGAACHQYIMFLDADDIAKPEMIEKCMSVLQADIDIIGVATYAQYIGKDESSYVGVQQVGPTSKQAFFSLYHGNNLIFLPATTLFKKEYFVKAGGFRLNGFPSDRGIRYQDYCDDLDLWCRMSDFGSDGKYFVTIPEPLFLYRKTAESLTAKRVFVMQEKMRWIKECLKRRRSLLPERSFTDYRSSISITRRFLHLRVDYAAFLYKKLAFCYMEHQYVRAIPLVLAVVILSSKYVIQKLKTQKGKLF